MANILTILRIIGTIPLIISIVKSGPTFMNFLIFSLIGFTDFLDGYIARKYNQVTNFGKIADGIADKFLMLGVTISLLINQTIPYWTLLIFIREILALLYSFIYIKVKRKVLMSNIYGKLKTTLHIISIALVLLLGYFSIFSKILLIIAILLIVPESMYAIRFFKES